MYKWLAIKRAGPMGQEEARLVDLIHLDQVAQVDLEARYTPSGYPVEGGPGVMFWIGAGLGEYGLAYVSYGGVDAGRIREALRDGVNRAGHRRETPTQILEVVLPADGEGLRTEDRETPTQLMVDVALGDLAAALSAEVQILVDQIAEWAGPAQGTQEAVVAWLGGFLDAARDHGLDVEADLSRFRPGDPDPDKDLPF